MVPDLVEGGGQLIPVERAFCLESIQSQGVEADVVRWKMGCTEKIKKDTIGYSGGSYLLGTY